MIIGLAALFAALALINTARDGDRRTPRRAGHDPPARRHRGQALRTVALETAPDRRSSRSRAGAAVVAISVHGVPRGLTGVPLAVPATLVAALTAGAAALGARSPRSSTHPPRAPAP